MCEAHSHWEVRWLVFPCMPYLVVHTYIYIYVYVYLFIIISHAFIYGEVQCRFYCLDFNVDIVSRKFRMHQSNKTIDATDTEIVVNDVAKFSDSKTKEKKR